MDLTPHSRRYPETMKKCQSFYWLAFFLRITQWDAIRPLLQPTPRR